MFRDGAGAGDAGDFLLVVLFLSSSVKRSGERVYRRPVLTRLGTSKSEYISTALGEFVVRRGASRVHRPSSSVCPRSAENLDYVHCGALREE